MVIFRRYNGFFFFLQKLYDSHLNFHDKEHHLCTEQYVLSHQKQRELFLRGKEGRGPWRSKSDTTWTCEGVSEGFWADNFYTGEASGPYQQDLMDA